MAGDAGGASLSEHQGDGPSGAREGAFDGCLTPVEAVRALPEPSFKFRRVYAFLFSGVLALVAAVCILAAGRGPVQWIGVAAIVGLVAIAFLYMDAARVADVARIAQSGLMLRAGLGGFGGGYGPYEAPDDSHPMGFRMPGARR